MKKIWVPIILILVLMLVIYFFISRQQTQPTVVNQAVKANQEFPAKKQIINNLVDETKLDKREINERNLWIQYVAMDQDSELELLVSYRYDIHKGCFFIYDYNDKKYKLVFSRPWAIERMNGHDVVVASGNKEIHQLQAKIIHMERGEVKVLWEAVIDKYNYTDLLSGTEVHGHYYVDTNSILHYFYKIEKTDKNAKVISREYKEEIYVWDKTQNKYVKQ